MTVPAPELDVVSSPGASVAQLLSAFQTGQIQALTGSVCGERLSPDAALTLLPFCMLFTFRCWHLLKGKNKTGMSVSSFPRQESEIDNPGAQSTSARQCGPCGAAKNWLELDHSLSRFSRPKAPGSIFLLGQEKEYFNQLNYLFWSFKKKKNTFDKV